MDQTVFDDHLAALKQADSTKKIKECVADILSGLGYTRWIYASENPYGGMGFPITLANEYGLWMVTYMTKGYMSVDPLVAHCRANSEPLLWDAGEGWGEAPEKVQALMKDAAANGFASGLTIPLRLTDKPPAMINISSKEALVVSRAAFKANRDRLCQVGLAMHAAVVAVMEATSRSRPN